MVQARYVVKVLPAQHQLEVDIDFGEKPAGEVFLDQTTWVPGAYGFMKYGRDLFDLRVDGGSAVREGWQGFRVQHAGGALKVHYKAGAFDPAWGELTGYVDQDHAVILGTRSLFVRGGAGPVQVEYVLPDRWKLHHPAGAKELGGGKYEYPSYAVMLDTPVVMGNFEVRTRTVRGTPFHHVFLDKTVGYEREVEGFLDVLVRVAEAAHDLYGSFPFDSYSYVFSFNPTAHWGLEHLNGTMIGLGEDVFVDPAARSRGVRVAAHELFHAWNVCRMKPAPIGQPDFAGGAFPDALWIAEGVTRYYEFLLSVRAGEYGGDVFFSNVVNFFRHLAAQPAYGRVSALDSSRGTFLNHNKYPGSVNATIDYYDKGMLVAFDLDVLLRQNGTSLDVVFKAFYDSHVGRGAGITHADFARHVAASVPAAADLLVREVERPGGLSTPAMLERLGFEVRREKVRYLGLVLKDNKGPEIANVLDDAPAGQTGIAPGDVILRVQNFPFSHRALQWAVQKEGAVRLDVRRGHRYFTYEIAPGEREQVSALVWRGSEGQARLIQDWLCRSDFVLDEGRSIPLQSFENFHGIQAVL